MFNLTCIPKCTCKEDTCISNIKQKHVDVYKGLDGYEIRSDWGSLGISCVQKSKPHKTVHMVELAFFLYVFKADEASDKNTSKNKEMQLWDLDFMTHIWRQEKFNCGCKFFHKLTMNSMTRHRYWVRFVIINQERLTRILQLYWSYFFIYLNM